MDDRDPYDFITESAQETPVTKIVASGKSVIPNLGFAKTVDVISDEELQLREVVSGGEKQRTRKKSSIEHSSSLKRCKSSAVRSGTAKGKKKQIETVVIDDPDDEEICVDNVKIGNGNKEETLADRVEGSVRKGKRKLPSWSSWMFEKGDRIQDEKCLNAESTVAADDDDDFGLGLVLELLDLLADEEMEDQ